MPQKLIVNGQVYFPKEGLKNMAIGIQDGKIEGFYNQSNPLPHALEIIDANQCIVLPGVIDAHAHLTMGDSPNPYFTETRAAAIGGVTTVLNYVFTSESYAELYKDEVQQLHLHLSNCLTCIYNNEDWAFDELRNFLNKHVTN